MVTRAAARWCWMLLIVVLCLPACLGKDDSEGAPAADATDQQVFDGAQEDMVPGDTAGDLLSDRSGPDSSATPDFAPPLGAITADHQAVGGFDGIPEAIFSQIRQDLRIFYGHTSHGSQLVTGMEMLASENASRYALAPLHEVSADLGHNGDLGWVDITRNFLDDTAHSEVNVVIWSWCGGVSDNTEEGIDTYLAAMDQLERDYPRVAFIYMTGHRDDSGEEGNLLVRNAQIRSWCQTHDKLLFDFADIESYDPGGAYHPNTTDACEWCSVWCTTHPSDCPSCEGCAHSHCFNCYLKGKAFWWLLARMMGWEG